VDWRERIAVDRAICHGRACIKGTRVMVSAVFDNLAAGETPEAIAAAYRLQPQDIQAALLYAAELCARAHRSSRRWSGVMRFKVDESGFSFRIPAASWGATPLDQ